MASRPAAPEQPQHCSPALLGQLPLGTCNRQQVACHGPQILLWTLLLVWRGSSSGSGGWQLPQQFDRSGMGAPPHDMCILQVNPTAWLPPVQCLICSVVEVACIWVTASCQQLKLHMDMHATAHAPKLFVISHCRSFLPSHAIASLRCWTARLRTPPDHRSYLICK